MMPLVTIMMNCSQVPKEDFKRMVNSCLNQRKVRVQLIVTTIEGDECIDWIDFPCELNVISLENHPGRNPNGSFYQINESLHLIRGDYFLWVGSDDILNLDKCILEIENGKGDICYTDYHHTDETLYPNHLRLSDYSYEGHLKGNFIPDCTVIPRKYFHLLPFSMQWYNCGFWDFWLRVKENGGKIRHLATPTWWYIQRKTSMHIARQKSPETIRMYQQHRIAMINSRK